MTRPIVAIERFFERLFERPATRLFHARLQPVQLLRRLERAMEAERRISADRTYVRDRYRIQLNPGDFADFEGFQAPVEAELAESLLQRARQRGYTLLARPRVRLEPSAAVEEGDIVVVADTLDPAVLQEVASSQRRSEQGRRVEHPAPPILAPAHGSAVPAAPGSMAPWPVPATHAPSPPPTPVSSPPLRYPGDRPTAAYEAPATSGPEAIIEITGPGMSPERVAYRGGTLQIGRAPDTDIVLVDERVSRRHGSITSRLGALIYTDLGSTNGSFVNGTRVTEIALGTGDVVRLGNTTLTIRPAR